MSSSSVDRDSWISIFCSLVGHEYFAEVSEDFIEDDFNLTGLQSQVIYYKEALELILDVEPESDYASEDEAEEDEEEPSELEGEEREPRDEDWYARRAALRRSNRIAKDYGAIENSAEMLYGLIHQRFITSRQGIQQMLEKYEIGHFGSCPRVHCRGAKVLPVGCSDIPGQDTVKLFCPACLDVYAPPNSRFQTVDGAFFGTTFGCLFFMTFPELEVGGTRPSLTADPSNPTASQPPAVSDKVINGVAAHNLAPGLGAGNIHEPKIYGFRVSELARTGPRMRWLRQRPVHLDELDETAIWDESHQLINADEDEIIGDAAQAEDVGGELGGEDEEDEVDEEEEEEEEDEGGAEGAKATGEAVDDGAGKGKKGRRRANGAAAAAKAS